MITEIILCAVIAAQAILHYIERDKLCNRIMSRNLNEYKAKEPTQHYKSAHERVLKKWRGSDNE